MMQSDNVRVEVNPKITPDQLFAFYQRNHICEEGYGKDLAAKPLHNSNLIVAAFEGENLVGIARALFDGLSAVIMEFCIELNYQGEALEYKNGSLIGKDSSGLGKRIGDTLLKELFARGASWVSCCIVDDYEESFYESLGFQRNSGHSIYCIDKRPYLGDERYITTRQP